jgi:Domain of unknown function (DUF4383)
VSPGFVRPVGRTSTSTAPAYNVFHLAFGALGLAASTDRRAARAFVVGFGLIDLYQLVASRRQWFPARQFRWTSVDDLLHLVVGTGLVGVGLFGGREPATVMKGDNGEVT